MTRCLLRGTQIVCDFKVQVLKFTPDPQEACQSKLAIRLGCERASVRMWYATVRAAAAKPAYPCLMRVMALRGRDVKLFNAEPKKLKTLKLTLKEGVAGITVTSPGGALPPGSDARECSFVFATQAKFDEVVEDLQAALVFRSGVYDTDFERVVRACWRCTTFLCSLSLSLSEACGLARCAQSDTPVGKGGNGICYRVRRRGAAAGPVKYIVKELLGCGPSTSVVAFSRAERC